VTASGHGDLVAYAPAHESEFRREQQQALQHVLHAGEPPWLRLPVRRAR
jgi:hypothetical protein